LQTNYDQRELNEENTFYADVVYILMSKYDTSKLITQSKRIRTAYTKAKYIIPKSTLNKWQCFIHSAHTLKDEDFIWFGTLTFVREVVTVAGELEYSRHPENKMVYARRQHFLEAGSSNKITDQDKQFLGRRVSRRRRDEPVQAVVRVHKSVAFTQPIEFPNYCEQDIDEDDLFIAYFCRQGIKSRHMQIVCKQLESICAMWENEQHVHLVHILHDAVFGAT